MKNLLLSGILSFLLPFSLFAESGNFYTPLPPNGAIASFSIDPMQRGADIVSVFNTLSSPPYVSATSEIGMQTTGQGFIPNLQNITPATNSTLLIVTFQLSPGSLPEYAVVPVEQVIELIYSPFPISRTGFISTRSGNLPLFEIDPSQRSVDIQNVVSLLTGSKPYKASQSSVSLQTTLNGPFYPCFVDGLIPNVKSVSLAAAPNGTLLLVNYKIGTQFGTIVVAPDQIYGILYLR